MELTELKENESCHQQCASVIKSVHAKLRKEFHHCDNIHEIWENHLKDDVTLSKYSNAMKDLAINHWPKRGATRIDWCKETCIAYFIQGGLLKVLEKDKRRELFHNSQTIDNTSNASSTDSNLLGVGEKILLLDVGSCYNPFKDFEEFVSLGLDLCPADKSVYICDFLNVHITNDINTGYFYIEDLWKHVHTNNTIKTLPGNSFHVVVFSLLLEYFPSKYQRLNCCKKAYELLMPDGLLLIITPDSGHVGRNAHQMKSWKLALSKLGFHRWRYEKQEHLHCMAFRKIKLEHVENESDIENCLYIPQDSCDAGIF